MAFAITRPRLRGIATGAVFAAAAMIPATVGATSFALERIAIFTTNIFDESAAEIVAHDPTTQRLFVTNSSLNRVDVFDLAAGSGTAIGTIALAGGSPTSVAVKNGIVAVAVANPIAANNGQVEFFNADGLSLGGPIGVGPLPDMLTFTPDGTKILVANEGEPSGGVNPEGSISIIDVSGGVGSASVTTADFSAFNGDAFCEQLFNQGAHFSPGTTSAQDFEPEYITITADGSTAFVSLQEVNSIAVVDIATDTVTNVFGLGVKDHSLPGNALDPSNQDGGINIANHPVFGLYQPDAIATFETGGQHFIVTANEGDARGGEDERIRDLDLDPTAFPNAAELQANGVLGRLHVTTNRGDIDDDGEFEQLFSYGGRSFSIYTADGTQVFDSGDDFEQIIASLLPDQFNSNNDANDSFDSRSDDKGPEPEGVAVGVVDGHVLAFIGLERIGGIMVYDITDPFAPEFILYQNDRDFSLTDDELEQGLGLAFGPEGLLFIGAADSPFGVELLIVANEVSGNTDVYAIRRVPEPAGLAMLAAGLMGLGIARYRRRRDA